VESELTHTFDVFVKTMPKVDGLHTEKR